MLTFALPRALPIDKPVLISATFLMTDFLQNMTLEKTVEILSAVDKQEQYTDITVLG